MKILVLNGSPKAERSNTLRLSTAFLRGLETEEENEVKTIHIAKTNIKPCRGCFCCWNKTPGKCVIADEMSAIIEAQLWADMIIWSFPLYYFNVPGILKNLIDRQLPMVLPFMTDGDETLGSGAHQLRYDMSGKKHMLISTCGFYSAEKNYDSVLQMFSHICGKDGFEHIFCGQGELFSVPELHQWTDEYLAIVKQAGAEYLHGGISAETRSALVELLYPKTVFEKMADASWGVDRESGIREDETLTFTKQMAALYNKSSYDGKERILEICYTDKGYTYQILLDGEKSRVYTDGSLTATTRIDTPWEVWQRISRGEIRGDVALAQGLYRVSGDFSLMINWSHYFGGEERSNKYKMIKRDDKTSRKASLSLLLLPWIAFWVCVSFEASWSALIPLAVCLLLPLIKIKQIMTVYDDISILTVGALSLFSLLSERYDVAFILGYLCFGLLWLGSCLTKEPLCAAYVKYGYGGDEAMENPIFMKTNYILATAWGVLFIVLACLTYLLFRLNISFLSTIINNVATILMGIFTAWFEKWYPAYVASGRAGKHKKKKR